MRSAPDASAISSAATPSVLKWQGKVVGGIFCALGVSASL